MEMVKPISDEVSIGRMISSPYPSEPLSDILIAATPLIRSVAIASVVGLFIVCTTVVQVVQLVTGAW